MSTSLRDLLTRVLPFLDTAIDKDAFGAGHNDATDLRAEIAIATTTADRSTLFVKVTQQGLDRVPTGYVAGDLLPVHRITPGAGGNYWVAHVHDGKGNVWSLGELDWTPAGLNIDSFIECDHCATIIDSNIRRKGCCAECSVKHIKGTLTTTRG